MFDHLFSPIQIGTIQAPNRIQITPHSQHYFRDGLPTNTLNYYYEERARGGAGILEVSQIYLKMPTGIHYPNWETDNIKTWPMVNSPAIIPGLRKLADTVHNYGSKIFMEVSAWTFTFGPVSPLPFETGLSLKELRIEDIREIEEGFAKASSYLKQSHFDGIDLHGSHGAMIEHFYSPAINRRTDKYGGNLENRMRFLLEIIDAVKGVVGDSIAVGMRLCADEKIDGGVTPDYAVKMSELLDGKLDFINVDSGSVTMYEALNQNAFQTQPLYSPTGYGTYMSGPIKRVVKKTMIGIAGRITDALLADSIIEKGEADYVGMTRALIADPDLPMKAKEGRLVEIRPCIGTLQDCWGRSAAKDYPMRCTVNPAVGREQSRGADTLIQARIPRKILIIGSGPAGLEAARISAMRGHQVVIYERGDSIGGQVNLGKLLPGRTDIGGIITWYDNLLRKLGVRIELHKEVPNDEEVINFLLSEEKPDVVILGLGSHPIRDGIQMITFREVLGWNRPNVHCIDEILRERKKLEGIVIVADSTTYIDGPGIAEWLSRNGAREVLLVTPHPQIAPELDDFNQSIHVVQRLAMAHVSARFYSWVKHIEEDRTIIYNIPTGAEERIEADHVVLNTGRIQDGDSMRLIFERLGKPVFEVGDSKLAGGRIGRAIESGFEVGTLV